MMEAGMALIIIKIGMEIDLKKQADTYFQSISDFDKAHEEAAASGDLRRFYVLSLRRLLGTEELGLRVVGLHQAKTISWPLFIDAVWGLSLGLPEDSVTFKCLADFVADIDRKNIVARKELMLSLPENLLDAANIEKKAALQKKLQKAFSKYYYDQKKYNLLRQNNEGYAKLCLLLATIRGSHSFETTWNKVLSLIGNFDLDPDRVLDLLIESYLQSANSQVCLNLIKNFNAQSIATLIGNRIVKDCTPEISEKMVYAGKVQHFITGSPEQLSKDLANMVNPKLIRLLCYLIKDKTVSLDHILPFLSPHDSVFEMEQLRKIQNGKEKILKSFKLMMEQLTEEEQQKIKQEQNLKFLGQMIYSSKLALLNGFVCLNDWENFTAMWSGYQNKVDLIIYQPLIKSLMDMLEWVIDPLYAQISNAKYFNKKYQSTLSFPITNRRNEGAGRAEMTQIEELNGQQFMKIVELMKILKIYVGFNTKLYVKLCRIFAAIIKQPGKFSLAPASESMQEQNNPYDSIRRSIQQIVREYLLPGVSLQVGNPALPKQISALLDLFDYRFRFGCYLYHYSDAMTSNPYFAHIFFKTRNRQIVIVNNLSDKNKRIFMKKMAKLTHNQALQTFYWIFRRILMEDYEKVVPEIVGVLAQSCSLTLQMSIFVALHILNEQKQPAMNFKTGQQSPWFKNLINFISLFYRKYLEIDIQPVFDYIIMKIGQPVQELQSNEQLPGALLNLLHEILSKMFCNFVLKEVNKSKLEMLCAGPKLQLETMDISDEIKASKKSKVILEKFFWGKSVDQYEGQSLAISLLVLLTQKRAELLHKSYISNIKIIGDIYDDYTVLIIQLVRVLNQLSSSHEQYAKLMPENSLNLLINEYKLPLEIAFEIYRPSVEHISTMKAEKWTELTQNIGEVMAKFVSSEEKYINRYGDNDKLKQYLNENHSKISNVLPNEFFSTFWMLTLDSIYFPAKLYSQKIQQTKKKSEVKSTKPGAGRSDKTEREIQKAKALLQTLKTEQIEQQKKAQDTLSEQNITRLKVQFLKNIPKDENNASQTIQQFVQIFVQVCLLPRMMLDPEEAMYCMKITIEVIKANKLTPGKSIKLLIFIIEHVMSYLPYSTEREAAYCLSIFLSEMLSIVSNWNDALRFKQDMKRFLGIDEAFFEDNYQKTKKQFLKLFMRFLNIVKSIKDEPYSIKNCLYLLEKVDLIPAYRKQAEDLENYLKQLKDKYPTILTTIIEVQLSILGQKKKLLPIIEQQGQAPTNKLPQLHNLPTFQNIPVQLPFSPAAPIVAAPIVSATTPGRIQNKPVSPIRSKNDVVDKIANARSPITSIADKFEIKKEKAQSHSLQQRLQPRLQRSPKPELKADNKHELNTSNTSNIISSSKQAIASNKQSNKIHQRQEQQVNSSKSQVIQLSVIVEPKGFTSINPDESQPKSMPEKRTPKAILLNESIIAEQPQKTKNFEPAPRQTNLPTVQMERIPPAIQTVAQRKLAQERQKQQLLEMSEPQPERIKTLKQLKDQNARKQAESSSLALQSNQLHTTNVPITSRITPVSVTMPSQGPLELKNKQPQPLQNEKLKAQTKKEPVPPINQKSQWQAQEIKRKQFQPSVQFSRRTNPQDALRRIPAVEFGMEKSHKESERKEGLSPIIGPTVQNRSKLLRAPQTTQSIPVPYKPQKREQRRSKSKQKSREPRMQWNRAEKQDRFSLEMNQGKQYKRDNRNYDNKNSKPGDSKWRDREDYRDKHNEDKKRQDKDRSRRKQDKYDRSKDRERKHDSKGKDRSRDRERDYRK